MTLVVVIYAALLGLIIGSAINAVVWRIHAKISWVHGRSQCPDCGHQLAARDLIPVWSWALLRGRCRYCGHKISWQYPLVELATGVLFAWSTALLPLNNPLDQWAWLLWLSVLALLIILAVYDLRWMLLPDRIMIPAIVIGLTYVMSVVWPQSGASEAGRYCLGALAAGGFFYALAAFSGGRAMGGGDIKLAFLMGLLLSPWKLLVAMELAFVLASVFGVVMLAVGRLKRGGHLPFGPFLVLGTIVSYLYGGQIIDAYLKISGMN
jgi:prepilin signal peptidase PulO-like enzyme (type II secretory pathway)